MSINSIDFLPSLYPLPSMGGPTEARASGDFGKWLAEEMRNANLQILDAERQVRELSAGNSDNLHQVMISLEEARLSFQLMLQVRNRLLEAYQEVTRMQV
jgi:flagellar hook-basal body complex protein FliE